MANKTTHLVLIQASQSAKEVTSNALDDAASPAMIFGRNATATFNTTWGYYGGRMLIDGVLTTIANGTIAVTASSTVYVEATRAGVVSMNTTAFTPGSIPLYTLTTGISSITDYIDERAWVTPDYLTSDVSVAVTGADVTLTAAQARARYLTTTGVLTANRSVILPLKGEWIVFCNNTGAFTTTYKGASGSGIVVAQGKRAILYGDGTNIVRVTADQ